MALSLHPRLWLVCAACLAAAVALLLADQDGAFARRVPLGAPYLGNCVAQPAGFRCSGDPSQLKAMNFLIRLKVKRDYRIVISGRSLAAEPAVVYVDFFGKDYDWAAQKGRIVLLPGAAAPHVLRWPSDWPPDPASLRLSSRAATDFEITAIHVAKTSKWNPRLRDAFAMAGFALALAAGWRDRRRLRASDASQRVKSWFAAERPDLVPLLLLAGGIAVLLLVRVATMTVPMVFGDEFSYALLASSLGDPTVYWRNAILKPLPNQLFFDVYHAATLAGEAMLSCARALNCLLFALAALPVFALSRKFVARREAFVLTALVLALPNNACTGFFMPESFYFLCFYAVAWAFVSYLEPGARLRHAAMAGFGLAALSLVKPHGLTILAACVVTLLAALAIWRDERRRLAAGLGVLLFVFAIARGVLGMSPAPPSGEPWFDRVFGLYANLISHTLQLAQDEQDFARLRLAAIDNVGALFLLFGPAFVACSAWLLRPRVAWPTNVETRLDRLNLFAGLALAFLVAGTIKFTAYIAGADPSQDPARINQRYYDFSFGLLLIAGYASYRASAWTTRRARVCAIAAAAAVAIPAVDYLVQHFPVLRASSVDHAVLFAVWYLQDAGIAYLGLALVLAVLLVPLRPRVAAAWYAAVLALLVATGYRASWSELAGSQTFWDADRAALAVKALVAADRLEHGLVVGDDLDLLSRTSFYLRTNASVRRLREHAVVDVAHLAADADWVLAFGEYRLTGDWSALALPAGATLYRRSARE